MVVEPEKEPVREPVPVLPQEARPENPFEAELRQSDFDFEELLKVKITGKGNTLQDLKKRLDDQKNLILRLREGLKSKSQISPSDHFSDVFVFRRGSKPIDQAGSMHSSGVEPESTAARLRGQAPIAGSGAEAPTGSAL
jgi:hypothetical protein